MINTYNESHLHERLKEIYALEFNGKTEQKIENTKWIADILLENDDVIEIQTGNVSALKEKVQFLVKNNKKVKVVHPILIEKFIEMYEETEETKGIEENPKLIYRKKSPKRETIYSMLRGLTGICDFLNDENFELEVIFIKAAEMRQKTKNPVQLKNKSRRHLKDWVPLGKRLESIEKKLILKTKSDYKNLLNISSCEFTAKELQTAIFESNFGYEVTTATRKQAASYSQLLIWLLKKMNIISEKGKRGREKLYEILF